MLLDALQALHQHGLALRELPHEQPLELADGVAHPLFVAVLEHLEEHLLVVGEGVPGPITQLVQRIYLSGVRGEVDWMRPFITPV